LGDTEEVVRRSHLEDGTEVETVEVVPLDVG
jgi:hypothetical protein